MSVYAFGAGILDGSMYAVVAARSYVIDSKLSCQTIDHQTLERIALVSTSAEGGQLRCRPKLMASRRVKPMRDQDVPAFMLLEMTYFLYQLLFNMQVNAKTYVS